MRFGDYIELKEVHTYYDEHLNEVESERWIPLGKCIIIPNISAATIRSNDGKEYVYSYQVVMRKPKGKIPIENKEVRIIKEDGTINKVCRVSGFVTLRYWLKLWL